ncbi:MAG: DUF2156 domain-containing protein [Spirochaetales bacterium]|nr:DUF2156 domain-containing protein [Spirochaetales bacterium]
MMEAQLTLNHAPTVGNRLNAMGLHIAEFSFPNLYLFRKTHDYQVITTEHGMFVSGTTYDKKRYLMPLEGPATAEEGCFDDLMNLLSTGQWDCVFPVPEEWLGCFPESEFHREYSLDDSDYLFFTEKFKTYPGKKMHKKKNLLNQFLKSYEPLLVPLTDDVFDDAKSILDIWQDTTPQEIAASDYHQCLEALELREKLGLTGAMAYADGKPAGFLLGEPLNEETYTIHFAKADISLKGVYQFLFSRFANDFCPDHLYINLEQDMGSEGLRKTKTSYRPDLMAHKYRITPR